MAIGGATVAELKSRMSEVEFRRWQQFYLDQPFDDVHRYYRPAALIASSMSGTGMDVLMDVLLNKTPSDKGDDAARNTFAAFGVPMPDNFE